MENSKQTLQEICGALDSHYNSVKAAYEAYDVFQCALKKYDATVLEIIFDKKEFEYEKIVWQIVTDLRRARDIDLDCDETAAGFDSYYLHVVSGIIEKNNKEIELVETSAITQKEYEAICQKRGLII